MGPQPGAAGKRHIAGPVVGAQHRPDPLPLFEKDPELFLERLEVLLVPCEELQPLGLLLWVIETMRNLTTNLALLMEWARVTPKELNRALGIDPSLISRWRPRPP